MTYLHVTGVHHVDVIEQIGQQYGLHPLLLEDIVNTDQRPKVEDYGDYLFLVLKMIHYDEATTEVRSEQVSIVLGANYVICFEENPNDIIKPIREHLNNSQRRIRKLGPDYLAYSIMDLIVDNYFAVQEHLGEDVEELEDILVTRPETDTLQELHRLRREVMFLRKAVWPLREVIGQVARDEFSLIQQSTTIYLRDIYDHTIQLIDTIETLRDMLSGMLDIYLSSVSNRMNNVMKVLTVIATIFMPMTFLAGIYGMNFKNMPEYNWQWSYPAFWVAIVCISIAMFIFFRRKRWI